MLRTESGPPSTCNLKHLFTVSKGMPIASAVPTIPVEERIDEEFWAAPLSDCDDDRGSHCLTRSALSICHSD
jgi:hypothetical protein